MTLETFFEKFDKFADAPDAVAKMRELVLDLAIRGRLVDPGNGAPTAASDLPGPFPIPGHWRWTTLSDVAEPCGQTKPDVRFTYVDVGAIDNLRGQITDAVQQMDAADAPSRARKLVRPGSVLYATVRPYLRNIAIVERQFEPPAIVSTAFAVLHPHSILDVRFLFHWLRSLPFQNDVSGKMKGVAYPAISDVEFWRCPVPVPPLAEQKRIVAKVDELMALCDRLEAQLQEREARHAVLSRAALARFADAPTPANLQLLFHPSYAIPPTDLRKTILTLAVQGKLVPQDPKEELVRPEHGYGRSDGGDDLPEGWNVAPLSGVADEIVDCPHSTPKWTSSGKICVRTNQFKPGKLDLSETKFVSDETFQVRIQRLKPRVDDILYSREGGILGIACRVPPKVELCLGQRMMLIRASSCLHPAYLELVLNAPLITEIARRSTTGGAAPRVNVATVKSYPIPFPHLAEQRRIVAKVDELMAMVDQLEVQLAASRATAAKLLDAVVAELTAVRQP